MPLSQLAVLLAPEDDPTRWRVVALEEFSWEPAAGRRPRLPEIAPGSAGDERRYTALAPLAESLAGRIVGWHRPRGLPSAVPAAFPFDTPAARADAVVHALAAPGRRAVWVSVHEPDVG